jgi:hypothetical protein
MTKSLDKLRNLDKKYAKILNFSIEIETNCSDMTKFQGLNKFLDLD